MTLSQTRSAIVARAKRRAIQAGYSVREGSYQGTADDHLGRFYTARDGVPFRPYGAGFACKGDAWMAVAETLDERRV